MTSDDLELIARCRRGESGAFKALYDAHAGRLYSLLLRMSGSAHDAEDLLQDVFLQAHRKLESFRGEASVGTWLYRMAVNHCLDHLRGKAARMTKATESLNDSGADEPRSATPLVPTAVTRVDLERALAKLPDGCRATFVLHDIDGFGHREIAEMLGISEGTSKSQVHKARMRLRLLLNATTGPREAGTRS